MEHFYKDLNDMLVSSHEAADSYFGLPLEVRRKVDVHSKHIVTVNQLMRQMDASLAEYQQNRLT